MSRDREGTFFLVGAVFGTKVSGERWGGMAVQSIFFVTGNFACGKGLALKEQVGLGILQGVALRLHSLA